MSEKKEIVISENRDFKGIWIPERIYLTNKFTPNEKFVLIEIYSLTRNSSRQCFASNKHFADFVGLKENTIQKMMSKFEMLGYIKRSFTYKENSKEIDKRIIILTDKFYNDFINETEKPSVDDMENIPQGNGCCSEGDGIKSIGVVENNPQISNTYLSNTEKLNIFHRPRGQIVSKSEMDFSIVEKQIAKEINNLGYGQDEELINNATEVFRYYYDKYYSCIGSYHLVLSSKAMRNTLERYINGSEIAIDLQYDIEAYKEMIDRHFTKDYGEEIDYSICHFMTEGIRNYLFYEVLY